MIAGDPNVANVELVATALGDLCDELVLVGGCAASLLIDAPSPPPPRVTLDVDLIVSVAALRDYHAMERRFSQRGLSRDLSPDAPIFRWRVGSVAVDLLPTEERVLGFSNRWYVEAVRTCLRVALPAGKLINLISAPAFLATKLDAFLTRGNADPIVSYDFEDMVNVIEGRLGIVDEVRAADIVLRRLVAAELRKFVESPDFESVLPGLVAFDELHEQRVSAVRQRFLALASLDSNTCEGPSPHES